MPLLELLQPLEEERAADEPACGRVDQCAEVVGIILERRVVPNDGLIDHVVIAGYENGGVDAPPDRYAPLTCRKDESCVLQPLPQALAQPGGILDRRQESLGLIAG